jgi:hypothetical protein
MLRQAQADGLTTPQQRDQGNRSRPRHDAQRLSISMKSRVPVTR